MGQGFELRSNELTSVSPYCLLELVLRASQSWCEFSVILSWELVYAEPVFLHETPRSDRPASNSRNHSNGWFTRPGHRHWLHALCTEIGAESGRCGRPRRDSQ